LPVARIGGKGGKKILPDRVTIASTKIWYCWSRLWRRRKKMISATSVSTISAAFED